MELMEVQAEDKVRKGYKRTELGVIPKDWEITSLGDQSEFITSGSRGWARFYTDEGALFVRSQNVRDGSLDFSDRQYVTPPKGSEGDRTRLRPLDLLITITGNSVGNVALVDRDLGKAYISQHVGLVRFAMPQIGNYVARYLAPGSPGNQQIAASQSGQSKPGLGLQDVRNLLLALPPTLPEQRAIATALSDADALLGGLEALIAKKQAIKQGAMQALLTPPGQPGHKRLPGFKGEWAVKRMNELGSVYGGLTGKSKVDFGNGMARYIPFMNIMNGPVIDTSFLELVNVVPGEVQNRALKGDLFFNGSSETPEEVGMCSMLTEEVEDLYLNSFSFGFHLNKEQKTDGLFLAYWFRSSSGREAIFSSAQGATRYNLAKANFLKLEVPCPKPQEQTAIATVLTDMDAELLGLEQQLAKLRLVKQGMMQELLTGRKRLV